MWSILIFFIALFLRIIYLLQNRTADPLFYFPIMDAQYHHDWAVSIIKGGWLGKEAFFRAPLYPYFLALIYRVFGVNLLIPRIIQSVIGSFSCVLVQKIGRQIFNKKVGNIAGVIAAFYPLFIFFDNELLIPSVLIFLVLLGLYSILRQRYDKINKWAWLVTGVVWGLAAITRPNVILFLIVLPFWLRSKLKRNFTVAMLYGILGVMGMIIPVTIRNYIVSNEFVPIAWQGGTNFYIGNNPNSDGMTAIIPGTRKSWWGGYYDAKRIAEEALGRELKNSEIDHYWFSKGFEFIQKTPLKAGLLFLRKTYLFFGGFEISNNRDIYFFTRFSYLKFLIWSVPFFRFPFGLLFPLALVGCWFAYRKRKDISLILCFIIPYAISFIIFFVCERYRLTVIPFLIILATFAITSGLEDFRKMKIADAIPGLAIFIASFIFFNANIFGAKSVNPALNYLTVADVEYKKGNYQRAISYLEKSLDYLPNYAEALNLLGATYRKMGDANKALDYYSKAVAADPRQPEAYFNIGNIYAETGRYDEARSFYLRAIEVDPYSAKAYNNLANIYFSRGDFKTALSYYEKAGTLEPNYVSPIYHAGLAEYNIGNIAKAESLWKAVLKLQPQHEGAQRAIKTFIK